MTSTQHRPGPHAEATIEADPTVPAVHIVRDFAATPAQLVRAHTDPELFARYILDRLGTSQRAIHAETARRIAEGHRRGFVRDGDPARQAAMVLLITQSAVQSAPLVAEWLPAEAWRTELAHAVRGYLAPGPGA